MVLMNGEGFATCANAVEFFGNAQVGVAMEESAELIRALSKYQRLKGGQPLGSISETDVMSNIVEEMCDVAIMLEQLQILLNIKADEIEAVMNGKLKRLYRYTEKARQEKCNRTKEEK